MKAIKNKLLAIFIAVLALSVSFFAFNSFGDNAKKAFATDFNSFSISGSVNVGPESAGKYKSVTFEYKIDSGDHFDVYIGGSTVSTTFTNCYGRFRFLSSGVAGGTYGACEAISVTDSAENDGYKFVTIIVDGSKNILSQGTAPTEVQRFTIRGPWSNATGTIKNIKFNCDVNVLGGTGSGTYYGGESVTVTADSAPSGYRFFGWHNGSEIVSAKSTYTFSAYGNVTLSAVYAETGSSKDFTVNEWYNFDLSDPIECDSVSFEYKITSGDRIDIYVGAASGDIWDNGYGRFRFTASGVGSGYTYGECEAVTVTDSSDGFKLVTIILDGSKTVTQTGTPPAEVQRLAIRGNWSDAAGTIKNIRFNNYADVTVVDGKGSMKNAVIGSRIPMVATPADGYMLDSWTDNKGNVVSTEESFLYEVKGGVTLTANYRLIEYYDVIVIGGSGGDTDIQEGTSVTIAADTAPTGYSFYGWHDGTKIVAKNASYTFTVEKDVTLSAIYVTSASASIGNYYYDAATLTKYDSLTFEYKIDNGDKHFYVYIGDSTVSSTFNNCYGGFKFTSSGISTGACDAVTVTDSSDGYKLVTIILDGSKTITTEGTAPTDGKVIRFAIRSAWTTATGTIKNLRFNKIGDVTVVNGTGGGDNIVDGLVSVVADEPSDGYYFLNWTDSEDNVVATTPKAKIAVSGDETLTANYRAYDGTKYLSSVNSTISAAGGEDEYYRVTFDYKISTPGAGEYINFYLQKDSSNRYGNFKLYGYDHYLAYDNFWDSSIAGFTVQALDDKYTRVTIDVGDIAAGKTTGDPSEFSSLYIYAPWTSGDVYIRNVVFHKKAAVTVVNGTGDGKYVPGAEVTVEADDPADGKVFLGWRDGSDMVSYDAEYTFNASEDVTLTAIYGTGYSSSASIGNYYYDAATLTKYDSLTFEYKIDNGDKHFYVYIGDSTVSSTFNNCYGGFKFTSSGISTGACDAVTVTDSSDGYKLVTIILDGSKTITTEGTAPTGGKVIRFAIRSAWTTATGTVKNIKFNKVCDVSVVNGTGSIDNIINGAEITIVAAAAPSGKVFVGWSDGSGVIADSTATYTFTVTDDVTMTAIYGTVYTITVVDGTIGGDTSAEIVEGRSATVVADDAPSGKYFLGWHDGAEMVSYDEEYTFTVSEDVTLTAIYGTGYSSSASIGNYYYDAAALTKYDSLTFEYKIDNGDKHFYVYIGDSTVSSTFNNCYGGFKFTSSGISTGACDAVTVTDSSDGYKLVTIILDGSKTITTEGTAPTDGKVIRFAIRSGWTSATGTVKNIKFNKVCDVSVVNGTGSIENIINGAEITIVANAAPSGKVFVGWDNGSGVIADSTATYTFTVTDDVTMTAIYGTVYTITVVDGTIGGDTSAEIVEGRSATVVADDAPNGKYFLGWSNNGGSSIIPSSATESYTFTVSGNVTMTAVYRAYDGTKYAQGSDAHIVSDGGEDAYASVTFEYKISTLGSDKYFNFYLQKDSSNRYGAFKLFGYDYYIANGRFTESAIDGVTVELLSDKYARVTIAVASIADGKTYGDPSAFSEIYIRSGWTNCDVYVRNIGFNNAGKPFSMHKGASVRIKAPYGIRFRADIPWDFYNEDASYGIIIIPYDYISKYSINLDGDIIAQLDSGSVKYRKLECEPIRLTTGDYYIQGSLTNIYESNLTRQFVGIGYSLIDDTYTYATNVDDCKRSIAAVSSKAIGLVDSFIKYNSTQQEFLVRSSGSNGEASATDLSVNAFDSLENFKKNESISTSGTLTLSAAKGESEFGQIVLTAKTAAINGKGYAVIVSDLTHSDGSTILDKSAFDVFNGHYINVADNWVYYGTLGYESTMTTGYYVDAIVPFSAAAKNEETVFDRTYGNNQTVFIRFNVPEDQKAGTYTGTFKVYVLGVGYMNVPVSFTVYNFALPEENNLKSAFGIDRFSLMRLFGSINSKETEEYEELYELIKDYGINGMYNPQNYFYGENSADDYIQSLVDAYNDEKIAAVAIETFEKEAIYTYKKGQFNSEQSYTVNVVIEEDYQLCNPDTGEIIEGAHNFGTKHTLKLIAEYSIANNINLFEKLYFLVGDEPSKPEHCIRFVLSYNACRRGIDYVLNDAGINWTGHEDIKASLQNLPIFVDSYAGKQVTDYTGSKVYGQCAGNKLVDDVYSKSARYTSDYYNYGGSKDITITYEYIDDYVSAYDDVYGEVKDSKAVAILNDSDPNTHIWWYGCVVPLNPYQSYHVNANHVITRSNFWAQYYYGVEGMLYYLVNRWVNEEYNISTDVSTEVVLTEDEIWNGEARLANAYGDGTLVYPNVTRYDADFRFCATYRLVATKEGVDDYNYICYAQSLIDAMASGSEKTAAQNSLNTCVDSMVNQSEDRAVVNSSAANARTARATLVALIESLQ